jgi:hypothetical protein
MALYGIREVRACAVVLQLPKLSETLLVPYLGAVERRTETQAEISLQLQRHHADR